MDAHETLFIGEAIDVEFDVAPALQKKPGRPDRFVWRSDRYEIVELLREWHDYTRRDRMANNMRSDHLATAKRRGSWGVGRDYYRIRTHTGHVFDLYYDRSPRGGQGRKGSWVLYREIVDA